MLSERLRQLRKEAGYTKRALLKHMPLNYSTYANYESGIREPNFKVLQTIAKFYDVSMDYILGATDDPSKLTDKECDYIKRYRILDAHGRRLVDFVLKVESERIALGSQKRKSQKREQNCIALQVFNQRASAGLGNYLDDYSDSDFEVLSFLSNPVSIKADFGVRLQGDSMKPKYKDNDVVCVKSVPRIDPEQIGIFIYGGEAYCKRLKIDRHKCEIYLESLNKKYAPKLISQPDQLKTVGLVLGVAEEVG